MNPVELFLYNLIVYKIIKQTTWIQFNLWLKKKLLRFCVAVTPSYKEPVPGWVDNLNGPTGILLAGGKGVIRSMLCHGELNAEIVPVDLAINIIIIITSKIGSMKQRYAPLEIRLYLFSNIWLAQTTILLFTVLNQKLEVTM